MASTTADIRSRKGALKQLLIPSSSSGRGGEEDHAGRITEEEPEPLSPSARLFHQPQFNCCIIAIMGSAKKIETELCKAGLEATLIRHPRFSSVQILDDKGEPCKWVRTKVVMDDHIVIADVDPLPENPDKFVEDYISGLSTRPLDLSRPLWDVHVLNLSTSEAEATAVFRIHHSLGDGISLMSLVLACSRKSADPECPPTITVKRREVPWAGSGFLSVFRLMWNTAADVVSFLATSCFLKDTATPLKGTEGVEFRPKRFVHRTLRLDDMRVVKNAMDLTVNDVVMAVTNAGLSRYLSRRYGEENGGRPYLPPNIRLRATILVNMREAATISDMAEMMRDEKLNDNWGNWVGYLLVPFTIELHEDPLDYVRKAKKTVDRKKHSLESVFTFSTSTVLLGLCGVKAMASLTHKVVSNTTMAISNVVGPAEEISFCGHPMTYLAPSFYGHPQALTVNFQSYMDKMTMVVAVDEDAIPDPHQLCQDFADSLKLIKEAVLARNK